MLYTNSEEHGMVDEVMDNGNGHEAVSVVMDNGEIMPQPDHFRVCPLGMQFYSREAVPEYVLLDLKITVLDADGTSTDLACTGAVVLSRYDPGCDLYRIWVVYVDLDDEKRNVLSCTCKEKNLLCPHCMNF